MNTKLTPQQIENWRRVLSYSIGPYALIMLPEEIEAYRDKMERDFAKEEEQTCSCCGKPRSQCCAGPD